MTNINNNSNPSLKAFLFAVLAFFAIPFASALPSTAPSNLQTSSGVTFQTSGSNLSFTAPNKSVLNWNNFGSGTDTIGLADTISFNLPNASSSILNVVNGNLPTLIDGTLTSNAKVYILNPNGIVIGPGGRVEVPNLVLSTIDLPFSSQFQFASTGQLPSETSPRSSGGGNIAVNGTAIFSGSNVTMLTKDIAINGGLINSALTINADGAVSIGSANNTVYILNNLNVTNPTGNTVLGAVNGYVGSNGSIAVATTSGNITNASGATISAKSFNVSSSTGDVNLSGVSAANISAAGKNVSLTLPATTNITVSATTTTGNINITGASAFTVGSLKNTSGATNVTSAGKLTIGDIHVDSNSATAFTGTSIADSANNVFIYGPVSFTATAGDINITKAGHSFGPISAIATTNVTIYEGAAMNLNTVRARELVAKTGEFFFQTPLSAALNLEKFSLTSVGNVNFTTGNISNGLTITSDGNVDLSRLSLATNLNNVAPAVTAKGTVANPAP